MRVAMSGFAVGNPAGLGRASRTYILALLAARPGWDLHVYLRSENDLKLLRDEAGRQTAALLDRLTVHCPPVLLRPLNRLFLEELDMPGRLSRLRADVFLGLDFTLPGRRIAAREAVVIYDLLPLSRPETVSLRARLLYSRGIKRAVSRGARLICISDYTRRRLHEYFPDKELKTSVARLALSPHMWNNALGAAEQDHVMQVRGTNAMLVDPRSYLLYVGSCGPRKNVELLVDVYSKLVSRGIYSGALVLAGCDGRFHTVPATRVGAQSQMALQAVGAQMQQADEGRGRPEVHDLGYVNDFDLSQLYRNADLLVNLSLEEGFGYPVLEALAHGTPALVTKGSAMAEVAERGIVETPLEVEDCVRTAATTLDSLPQLRLELRAQPEEFNQFERMGNELAEALEQAD